MPEQYSIDVIGGKVKRYRNSYSTGASAKGIEITLTGFPSVLTLDNL
jgi:hypothetical protein